MEAMSDRVRKATQQVSGQGSPGQESRHRRLREGPALRGCQASCYHTREATMRPCAQIVPGCAVGRGPGRGPCREAPASIWAVTSRAQVQGLRHRPAACCPGRAKLRRGLRIVPPPPRASGQHPPTVPWTLCTCLALSTRGRSLARSLGSCAALPALSPPCDREPWVTCFDTCWDPCELVLQPGQRTQTRGEGGLSLRRGGVRCF